MVRRDLPLAQQSVQAIHAAVESSRRFPIPPSHDHPHLVLLSVADETELLETCDKLRLRGVGHVSYREPDMGNEMTAIASGLIRGKDRNVFRKYDLFTGD